MSGPILFDEIVQQSNPYASFRIGVYLDEVKTFFSCKVCWRSSWRFHPFAFHNYFYFVVNRGWEMKRILTRNFIQLLF